MEYRGIMEEILFTDHITYYLQIYLQLYAFVNIMYKVNNNK